jgi:hypothetical protein
VQKSARFVPYESFCNHRKESRSRARHDEGDAWEAELASHGGWLLVVLEGFKFRLTGCTLDNGTVPVSTGPQRTSCLKDCIYTPQQRISAITMPCHWFNSCGPQRPLQTLDSFGIEEEIVRSVAAPLPSEPCYKPTVAKLCWLEQGNKIEALRFHYQNNLNNVHSNNQRRFKYKIHLHSKQKWVGNNCWLKLVCTMQYDITFHTLAIFFRRWDIITFRILIQYDYSNANFVRIRRCKLPTFKSLHFVFFFFLIVSSQEIDLCLFSFFFSFYKASSPW